MSKKQDHEVKVKRTARGFTMVQNAFLNNPNLSWKAKAIFIYMIGKPEGWKLNIKGDLVKRSTDGAKSVYNGIAELVEAGYVSRTRARDFSITYHLFENSEDNDVDDYLSPRSQKGDSGNGDSGNGDSQKGDGLIRLKDNNTEYSNTEVSNDAPSVAEENSKPFIINRLIEHGVDKRLAEEYWHYRTTIIKSRPTNRAISFLINECISNNFDLSKAIKLTIANGWKGFKTQWVHNQQQAGRQQQVSKREAVEAHNARIAAELIAEIEGGRYEQ